MWKKILAAIIIIIALIIAVLAVTLSPSQLTPVIIISRFFEVMIPVLAVGALLKYLTRCPVNNVWDTILSACMIFIALVLAFLAIVLPPTNIHFILFLSRFFEVMIPILAVGALLKYLVTCKNSESSNANR